MSFIGIMVLVIVTFIALFYAAVGFFGTIGLMYEGRYLQAAYTAAIFIASVAAVAATYKFVA